VPEGRSEKSVRVFPTFTADLKALADWLQSCQVTTVAMESTGVYWIPSFQILEARGFAVYLVNAQYIKVTGSTGMKIIRDILAGIRDPQQLSRHRDHRCRKSEGEIAKSLEGDYRREHLFALRQAVELYDNYTEKLQACDREIEQQMEQFVLKVDLEGLNILSVQTILSEIGTDMSKWPTVKHFTSWLGLSPNNAKTGGKIIRTKTKKTDSRANLAFRQAAATLGRSKSALGNFYRRMKAKLGTPKAVVATAHKLARILYHMLKTGGPYVAMPPEQEDAKYRERALHNWQRKARKLGAKLVLESTAA
jgi:transposase